MSNHKHFSQRDRLLHKKNTIKSFKAKMDSKRTGAEKFADWLTNSFGTTSFLIINIIFFVVWVLVNIGIIPDFPVFDPFPFNFLTMVVSLEAIFLAIIVLISQNRENRVNELREEVDLYINTYTESEITKLIYLQSLLLKKNGIDVSQDEELQQMMKEMESDVIEQELERQLF